MPYDIPGVEIIITLILITLIGAIGLFGFAGFQIKSIFSKNFRTKRNPSKNKSD